jgi:hypothetical protein
VFLEKPVVAQVVKELYEFYETKRFTVFAEVDSGEHSESAPYPGSEGSLHILNFNGHIT